MFDTQSISKHDFCLQAQLKGSWIKKIYIEKIMHKQDNK